MGSLILDCNLVQVKRKTDIENSMGTPIIQLQT